KIYSQPARLGVSGPMCWRIFKATLERHPSSAEERSSSTNLPKVPGSDTEVVPAELVSVAVAFGDRRCPLCWHSLPRAKAKGADPNRASRGAAYPGEIIPEWRAKSSWNAERDQIGMVGDIIANSRATSPGIRTGRSRRFARQAQCPRYRRQTPHPE